MQFVVMAHDGSDPDAVARRQAVRPTHLDGIRPLVDAGNILAGGAMLDDDGNMRGSVLLLSSSFAVSRMLKLSVGSQRRSKRNS